MKRRDFLKRAALWAAGAGGVLSSSFAFQRQARAFFGQTPQNAMGAVLPAEYQAQSVLELYLYGGVSQYETFYNVSNYGKSDNSQWYAFFNAPPGAGSVEDAVKACRLGGELLQPFGEDSSGNTINLGPFVMPLRERTDILDRMRILVTSHTLAPHEAAIPLMMTGRTLGNPSLAGIGAHVQRYFTERDGAAGRVPYAYVLLPSQSVLVDLTRCATAVGNHPSSVRPLSLRIDSASDFSNLLLREGVGSHRAEYDAAIQAQLERYQARLRWKGSGDPLRSPNVADLGNAAAAMTNVDALRQVLESKYFDKITSNTCGGLQETDTSRMNLNLAAHLLTHPTSPAKYVCVIDGGLAPDMMAAGGYDGHQDCTSNTAQNLTSTLRSLMDVIKKPGETAPGKIDLDKTMIVLSTEFGRTPQVQNGTGRGHWPFGFPTIFLGGPIRKENSGILGTTAGDATATSFSTPGELRVALLMALGIWPFDPDSFNIADVQNAGTQVAAAGLVLQHQFGLKV